MRIVRGSFALLGSFSINVKHPGTHFGLTVIAGLLTVSLSGCGSEDQVPGTADNDRPGASAAVRDDYGPFSARASVTIDHPNHGSFSYVVSCEGNASELQGAADVDADAACAALADAAVQKRLIDGAPADRFCAQVYGGPDTASIRGNVNRETFNATVDRNNGCGVADWDELLGDLLIEARGEEALEATVAPSPFREPGVA